MNKDMRKYDAKESLQHEREEKLKRLVEKHKKRCDEAIAWSDDLTRELSEQRDQLAAAKRREEEEKRARNEAEARLEQSPVPKSNLFLN